MALTQSDIGFYYPATWPHITGLTTIGGTINSGNPFVYSETGLFPTGVSPVPGASPDVWYSKIFMRINGNGTLTNPVFYITNEYISNQISIAPDPYWISGSGHAAQTGVATSRRTLPGGLTTGDFYSYTADDPLDIKETSAAASVVLNSGSFVGLWVKLRVQAGLPEGLFNTFKIGVRGEV